MRIRSALAFLPLLAGCDLVKSALKVNVSGEIVVTGDTPSSFDLQLYSRDDNPDAFNILGCPEGSEGTCLGAVDVAKLENPVTDDAGAPLVPSFDGNTFLFEGVGVDLYYVLVATGGDETIVCSTDVVGYDENTKLVTTESAITVGGGESIDEFALPRPVRLNCAPLLDEPTAPDETDPGESGDTEDDGDIGAGDDPAAAWTSFIVEDKTGSTTFADASAANAEADIECGDDFPSVLVVQATSTDTAATEAYLRIQFGAGDAAIFRTVAVPMRNGQVNQAITLTGGYSVVQLDLDESLDGVNESYTVTFCDRAAPPAQEMLTILTWDKDDTDVDTHIYSGGQEVAYYSLSQSWGDLDIDDVDGYGPETFTSRPSAVGQSYEVRVHYYSDHGNGATNATMRVVYYDSSTGEVCDITTSRNLSSYDWWTVGNFGPGLACPQ